MKGGSESPTLFLFVLTGEDRLSTDQTSGFTDFASNGNKLQLYSEIGIK